MRMVILEIFLQGENRRTRPPAGGWVATLFRGDQKSSFSFGCKTECLIRLRGGPWHADVVRNFLKTGLTLEPLSFPQYGLDPPPDPAA